MNAQDPRTSAAGFEAECAEYPMTAEDLARITTRAQAMLGAELGEHKRQMVYSRLSRRLRALGIATFTDYLDLLERRDGIAEREHFVNALTTNLTAFFREAHHFEHFEREILALAAAAPRQPLRIWSAGCSSGEEAYSLAMILHAQSAALTGHARRILATDLDTIVLGEAERGVYAPERLRGLPPRFRTPGYLVADPQGQGVAMVEPVRDLVSFRALNLLERWPFQHMFHVIFCRNVLIYFSAETKARVIDHMADVLLPGGILCLGHSESLLNAHPKLVAEGHTIYRRVAR